jgi:Icc-related predicted phosphoesterase
MGEYGYSDEFEIYYIGGAYSIDWTYRVEGVSWWNDEELSQAELRKVIDHVLEIKPHTIISHDCPQSILTEMFNIIPIGTRTGQAFDAIFEKHQPDIWIFGHHHRDITQEINNTKFICLDELSTLEI